MKTSIAILFFGLLAIRALAVDAAPAPLTVAVMEFTDDSEGKRFGGNVVALITAELASKTNLVMLDRAILEKALKEQSLGASGLVNSDTAAQIGQVTGVKALVSGHVITLDNHRLVIVADIIGTETARLLAVKVDGPENKLEEMILALGDKVAQAVVANAASLAGGGKESNAARLERIVKSVTGANRPTVQVAFTIRRGRAIPVTRRIPRWESFCRKRASRWWMEIPKRSPTWKSPGWLMWMGRLTTTCIRNTPLWN